VDAHLWLVQSENIAHRRSRIGFGLVSPPTIGPAALIAKVCDAATSVLPSAPIAQGIEQRFPKPCVVGSNPTGGAEVFGLVKQR
jgi:hypothetical protein